jgi:hypothetical protein
MGNLSLVVSFPFSMTLGFGWVGGSALVFNLQLHHRREMAGDNYGSSPCRRSTRRCRGHWRCVLFPRRSWWDPNITLFNTDAGREHL